MMMYLRNLVVLVCIGEAFGMTVYPVIEHNRLLPCRKDPTDCPLPFSDDEDFWRKHCYTCPSGGKPYCVTDEELETLHYICATKDEMTCDAGFYGKFTYMNDGNIRFEKLSCRDGTFVLGRRDCRRPCEDVPKVDNQKFTIMRPAKFNGEPALLSCNTENGYCVINPNYGETFNYTAYLNYDDVCGKSDKDCVYAAKDMPKVEHREKPPSTSPRLNWTSRKPDITLTHGSHSSVTSPSPGGGTDQPLKTTGMPAVVSKEQNRDTDSGGVFTTDHLGLMLGGISVVVLIIFVVVLINKCCGKKDIRKTSLTDQSRSSTVTNHYNVGGGGTLNVFENVKKLETARLGSASTVASEMDNTIDDVTTANSGENSRLLDQVNFGETTPGLPPSDSNGVPPMADGHLFL